MTTQNLVNIYFRMISRNSLGMISLIIRLQTSMSNLTDFMRNSIPQLFIMLHSKKVNRKQLKLRSKPWVTLHIQKLIRHRDKLSRNLKTSHSKNIEELYKKFRNRVVLSVKTGRVRLIILILTSKLINQI